MIKWSRTYKMFDLEGRIGMETAVLRPFHESIIEIIKNASCSSMLVLVDVLKTTRIPKNHDAIIEAWNTRWQELGIPIDLGVEANLLLQKMETEKEKGLVKTNH